MRRDSQKDPSIDPDAARARLILDQVLFFINIFLDLVLLLYIVSCEDKVKCESWKNLSHYTKAGTIDVC